MKHFRIQKIKDMYVPERFYPQYKKNILCSYRYLERDDVCKLPSCTCIGGKRLSTCNIIINIDNEGIVYADSLEDAETICKAYKMFIEQRFLDDYTYLDI